MPTSVLKTLRGYRRVVGISGVCQLIAAKAMGRQAVVPLVPVPGAAAVYLRVPSSDAAACRQVFFDREYLRPCTSRTSIHGPGSLR